MRIIELVAENIKRLRAVRIKPDGSVVQITGPNDAGKSTVLDAISYALEGKGAIPDQPIREGTTKAFVRLNLGDYTVLRKFTKAGTCLEVCDRDGVCQSPQQILNGLLGPPFDPASFSRMKPAELLATLKKVVGLDFTAVDKRRAEAYEERTAVNRNVTRLRGQVAGMSDAEAPDDEVSIAALGTQQREAFEQRAQNDEIQRAHLAAVERSHDAGNQIQNARHVNADNIEIAEAGILDMEAHLAQAKQELTALQQWRPTEEERECKAQEEEVWALAAMVEAIVDPDTDAIAGQIAEAEQVNANVRAKRNRAEVVGQLAAEEKQSQELTIAIDRIDEDKRQQVAAAKFPVEGLGFSSAGVTFNGLPFEQASSAQKLRSGVGIWIALNAKLRILRIYEGSLLDSKSLAILYKMAEFHDIQIWLERVAGDEPAGVVIEDGEVAQVVGSVKPDKDEHE